MKLLSPCVIFGFVLFGLVGCAKKEVSSLDRKQAANLVTEAQFALTLRDLSRAEGLLSQATALCPDTGNYWLALGNTRARLNQRDGARTAYKQALKSFENDAAKNKTDSTPALQQVYVLALLGRQDDARKLLDKISARYPDDRDVRAFVDGNQFERMLSDPHFKEAAL
jgi:tetratricopeptide (TPR) repeat protein